jgi:hypothetical protein
LEGHGFSFASSVTGQITAYYSSGDARNRDELPAVVEDEAKNEITGIDRMSRIKAVRRERI